MNSSPREHRLDAGLVAELLQGRPDLEKVVKEVHDLCDFFVNSAAAEWAVPAPTQMQAHGATDSKIASSRLAFFRRLLTVRVAALLPDAISGLNESNLLRFALVTRGMLETAAWSAYHAPGLVVPADATAVPEGYTGKVRAALMSGRFDWARYLTDHAARQALIDGYAQDPRGQEPAEPATNIQTMMAHLARRLEKLLPKARGIVLHDYALLSDLGHPATGSHLLFVTEVSDQLRADPRSPHVTRLGLTAVLLPCVGYSASAIVDLLADFEESNERLDRM